MGIQRSSNVTSWLFIAASVGGCSIGDFGDLTAENDLDEVESSSALSPDAGLRGEYFDNRDFTALKVTRTDPRINFNWGTNAPTPEIGADTFSVRWTGQVEAATTESYTFYTKSDDGVRLWIDDELVIDNWTDHAPTENASAPIALVAGKRYALKMEFYESGWGALAQLRWSSVSIAKQIVPRSRLYLPSAAPPPPPPSTGYPNATNTGPAPGTVFQDFTGNYEVHTAGAVINGLRVKGEIVVYADNVTIQNCEVDATGQLYGISTPNDNVGLKVKNCHVYATPSPTDRNGTHLLGGIGAEEIAFCNIHGAENATMGGTNYIHDNYIHDFARWDAYDDHTDGLQTYGSAGAGGLRVVHNTIIGILTGGDYTTTNYGAGSSAIALSEGMHDLTIDGNLLAGGSYTIYGPSQAGASPGNVHVTNNHFSTQYYSACGYYGAATGFNTSAPGYQWTGNVWHESGKAFTGP